MLKVKIIYPLSIFVLSFLSNISRGQSVSDLSSSIHGNFQLDAQYYNPDSLIGAPRVPEKLLSNAFGNINFTRGKFSAGVRYEAYNNVMQGFDQRYKGQGVTNRFARYQDDLLDITIGNIYEQFGSGLLLRTYYEPGLLYDNSLDGIRVISNPYKGITFKGLVGKQRSFFAVGPGIIRGFDGELNLNEMLDSVFKNMKTRIILGGSFVSKFQIDQDPDFKLPENVGSYGGRLSVIRGGFNFFGEYVIKENDPGADNSSTANGKRYYSYKQGEALFVSTSYAMKGFSFLLQAKRIDNMAFRSDRDATLQNLLINFLPATTRQHTYLMPALNPYATQPKGEVGLMAEVQFKQKKGSWLGGKYGSDITLNFSQANGLNKIGVNDSATRYTLYKTNYGEVGEKYYHDFFIELSKKFSKKLKVNLMYANQFYNKNMVQFGSPNAGYQNISAHIGVVDLTYKYRSNSAIRFETQGLFSDNKSNPNAGNWATGMVEWTPNTHFFLAVLDQYNYGNPEANLQLHYFLISAGYTNGPHRISLSAGKQRAGIFCVGGVCRNVPASNGIAISITSSF
ncbi:MAG: hypothetical protein JNJ40_12710 [Bacteroidia bacterium]|nr:hypothetical protein [Bacteroidia bacterium]